jgi:hypothetical protein
MHFMATDMIMHWKNYHHFRDLSDSVEQVNDSRSLQIPLKVRAGFENGENNLSVFATILSLEICHFVFL